MIVLLCTKKSHGLQAKKYLDSYGYVYDSGLSGLNFEQALSKIIMPNYYLKACFENEQLRYTLSSNQDSDELMYATVTVHMSEFLSMCRLQTMRVRVKYKGLPYDAFMPKIYDDLVMHYGDAFIDLTPIEQQTCKIPPNYHMPKQYEFNELQFVLEHFRNDVLLRSKALKYLSSQLEDLYERSKQGLEVWLQSNLPIKPMILSITYDGSDFHKLMSSASKTEYAVILLPNSPKPEPMPDKTNSDNLKKRRFTTIQTFCKHQAFGRNCSIAKTTCELANCPAYRALFPRKRNNS
jgi:hypothetical protein